MGFRRNRSIRNMKTKEYKLFSVTVLTVNTYSDDEPGPVAKPLFSKPKGEVLTYTPEEEQRDRDKETLRKMAGK